MRPAILGSSSGLYVNDDWMNLLRLTGRVGASAASPSDFVGMS
jgi:hypothetical protein